MKLHTIVLCFVLCAILTAFAFLTSCGENKPDESSEPPGGSSEKDTASSEMNSDESPEVVKKNFDGITFADLSVDYDGNEKEILVSGDLPEGTTVTYKNNKGTNAGTYNAEAVLTCDGYWPKTYSAKLTINKISYDMSGASWNYTAPFDYDGSAKTVTVTGLPDGVTVKSYTDNEKTDAGRYTASVLFAYDEVNHNAPSLAPCTWVINKIHMTVNITFSDKTVEYDEHEHAIELIGDIPAGANVKITYNDEEVSGVTSVGEYTVKLLITHNNYYDYTATAKLIIKSTEEELHSIVFNGKVYFQNNLDGNKLYFAQNGVISKVNNDIPRYFVIGGNKLYYCSSSMFSKIIKSYDGANAESIGNVSGEYLACDGTYIYYAVNNLVLNTSQNGIYKLKLDDASAEPQRLVKNKAKYLVYYGGNIYYANASDGGKLYSISVNAGEAENGTLIYDESVSYLLQHDGVLYFNATKKIAGLPAAAAIRKYVISSGKCVKLTTDAGKYLTKVGNDIYYINSDKITSEFFGDGIYKVSALATQDSSLPGTKVLSSENNGYSSLNSDGTRLYYYKLNDKHFYSYDPSTGVETDLMKNFVVPETTEVPKGYAKVAEYKGEIYYIDPTDNGCLYKYNPVTKGRFKVLADSVSNVYFYRDYMYYGTYILTNYALFRTDLKTGETKKISSDRCDNLIFDGDTVYYMKVGSMYNNYIMKMNLDGTGATEVYKDKNLWVASFEKAGDYLYFTTNTKLLVKNIYRFNLTTMQVEDLGLKSNFLTEKDGVIYYYNLKDNTLCSYNPATKAGSTLTRNVQINNMIVFNGYILYSSIGNGHVGLYKVNISTGEETKLSDKCAEGMTVVGDRVYYLQTAISYQNDYPIQTAGYGDGRLYCYDGNKIVKQ